MGNCRSPGKVKSFGVYSCMTNSILIFECDFILGSLLLFWGCNGQFFGWGVGFRIRFKMPLIVNSRE